MVRRFCKCGVEISNVEEWILAVVENWECRKCFYARTAKPEPSLTTSPQDEPELIAISDLVGASVDIQGSLLCLV